ncbi:penicillin-binding protein [Salirhabdus euzebyi]|uniref:serine-type D-Ala-D-Ala carboxypeptidase n=1 Tax=Salirhabdus euzebyi TaxID=394506 RepID=A0A841Q5C1_9BACI|nr:penicillin-binding transpeptidase domain-containing protein [Salirhabdus euzebyi]MBB6453584.1 penicillin-binding protein [Salirhabdus euzebyi]
MKKNWLALILLLAFFLLLTACKKEEEEEVKPEDRFNEFVELWKEQKFDDMYDEFLSTTSKEAFSKEEMVERYHHLYNDLEINNLSITYVIPEVKEPQGEETEEVSEVTYPFQVEMDSLAGKITFDQEATLVKETKNPEEESEENWYVNWDTTFIFPELEPGDKVGVNTTKGPRGEIFDRNGKGLAVNDTLYEIGIVPGDMEGQEQETKEKLAELLHLDVAYIDQQLNQGWVQPDLFVPIGIINPNDEALYRKISDLPGVWKQNTAGRSYPLGAAGTHLIGYTGEITAEELETYKDKGYKQHDIIGKRGLESLYEEQLKGKPGVEIYIEKENGDQVVIAEQRAEKGKDIHVTINGEFQKLVYENMEGKQGTAAAINPTTGETMALVSSPSFDPNGLTSYYYTKLMADEANPLLNRFTSLYAPGSTFKPITAAIALEQGTVTADATKDITGKTWGKGNSWGGYEITRVSDPGRPVNLEDALVFSDNIYFGQTALDVGADAMVQGLENFGFTTEVPYTYPIPSSSISNSGNLNDEILLADTAYGQGELQVSILHLATMYSPFTNGGHLVKPVLLQEEEKGMWKEQLVSPEHAEEINASLRKVVSSPNGTARGANMENIPLAGKTGTAELKSNKDEKGAENGVFVAYNSEQKDLIIAMLMENVEDEGSSGYVVQRVKSIFEQIY